MQSLDLIYLAVLKLMVRVLLTVLILVASINTCKQTLLSNYAIEFFRVNYEFSLKNFTLYVVFMPVDCLKF